MSAGFIETKRTRMRPFEEADAEDAFVWFSDAEVMRFIPGGADGTLEETRRRIARYREHQARFGFSKWLIIQRETGQAIGDSGLFHLPDGKRIELGFRLARPHWGLGYATEVGRAWLKWFDAHLAGEPLFADVHPDHVKSQLVLSKLGFRPSHSELIHGLTMLIYRSERSRPNRAVLSEQAVSIASAYWAAHFGCPPAELFAEPLTILTHGAELADYRGVFALLRGGAVTVSIPRENAETIRALLLPLPEGCSPDDIASALAPIASIVIGPAYIGYAEDVSPPPHAARALGLHDAAALDRLQQSCHPTEWEHGGSSLGHPCSAVFLGREIAALAGYEVWGRAIAHISVITHPSFRGRGFGRSAVAHLSQRALADGLLPQYRTLDSNQPSIRLAKDLGFIRYATSLAVRMKS